MAIHFIPKHLKGTQLQRFGKKAVSLRAITFTPRDEIEGNSLNMRRLSTSTFNSYYLLRFELLFNNEMFLFKKNELPHINKV